MTQARSVKEATKEQQPGFFQRQGENLLSSALFATLLFILAAILAGIFSDRPAAILLRALINEKESFQIEEMPNGDTHFILKKNAGSE